MRGFGRCRLSDHAFCVGNDCKRKIDYAKSVAEMGEIAKQMREKYPGLPLYLIGESLGATVCLAVAAQHPDLVDGIVLSGPAVRVNHLMYDEPRMIADGLWAVFIDPKFRVGLTEGFVHRVIVLMSSSIVLLHAVSEYPSLWQFSTKSVASLPQELFQLSGCCTTQFNILRSDSPVPRDFHC